MAVYVVHAGDLEDKGRIGHALADIAEIHNVFLVAAEDQLDIPDNVAVGITDIVGIKLSELFKVVKLIDGARCILLEIQFRHVHEMIAHQPFPEFLVVLSCFQVFVRNLQESSGIIRLPESVAEHDQTTFLRLLHADDASLFIDMHEHLVLGFGRAVSGTAGTVLKGVERIFGIIAVALADIGVLQIFRRHSQTFDIVLDIVKRVEQQAHAVLFLKVCKHVPLVAQHHRDIPDPGFLELLDLALDQAFTLHFIQALGLLQGKWNKPGRRARRQDHRVLNSIGFKGGKTFFGQPALFPVNQALFLQSLVCFPVLQCTVQEKLCPAIGTSHGRVIEIGQYAE